MGVFLKVRQMTGDGAHFITIEVSFAFPAAIEPTIAT
jgi:hypothetical protein